MESTQSNGTPMPGEVGPTMILIGKINGQWVGKMTDLGEWLPLPFTPEAERRMIKAFYLTRFDIVIMTQSTS